MNRKTPRTGTGRLGQRTGFTGLALAVGFILLTTALAAGALPDEPPVHAPLFEPAAAPAHNQSQAPAHNQAQAQELSPATIAPLGIVDGANSAAASRLIDGHWETVKRPAGPTRATLGTLPLTR